MLQRKRNKASRYKTPKAKRMTARVFSGEQLPAVEQFNTGRNRGCIVRWDFETVKTPIQSNDKRANFAAARLRNEPPKRRRELRHSSPRRQPRKCRNCATAALWLILKCAMRANPTRSALWRTSSRTSHCATETRHARKSILSIIARRLPPCRKHKRRWQGISGR